MSDLPRSEWTAKYRKIRDVARKHYDECNDCTVVATAMGCGVSYGKAHTQLRIEGREQYRGTAAIVMESVLRRISGKEWVTVLPTDLPKLKTLATAGKAIPKGRVMLFTNGHVSYMEDGVVHDHRAGKRDRINFAYVMQD